jgi:signal peptidase II
MNWLWISVVVVALDQVTKHIAVAQLTLHEPLAVAPVLNLTLTYNAGAAFSFLGTAGGWQRWLFMSLSTVISVVLIVWLARVRSGKRWLSASLSLILGGAVGNLWDRVVIGRVVDFVDVHYSGWHWPAFNVADSAICIGAVLLLITSFGDRAQ